MARGRMISSTLGESRKYAALRTDIARVLFPLIVANTDKSGRLEADAQYITRKLCVLLPYERDDVEDALQDLGRVGLIVLYAVDGQRYLQVVKFLEHNTPNYQEPDSKIPPPGGYEADGSERDSDASRQKRSRSRSAQKQRAAAMPGMSGASRPHDAKHDAKHHDRTMPSIEATNCPRIEREVEVEVEEKRTTPSTTEVSSSAPAPKRTPIPDADDFREAPDPLRALRELPKKDKQAAMRLDQVATGKKRWTTAQKAEAARLLLQDRERAMNALNRTFDLLDGLQYPFAFFRKALETPAITEVPLPEKGTSEFDALIRAAMEGDIDEVKRLSN